MPDPKTTAAPASPKKRKLALKWSHLEVGALVADFHAHGLEGVEKRADPTAREPRYGLHDAESAKAKLIELGLVAKPEKPVISKAATEFVGEFVTTVDGFEGPDRVLAARLAIMSLRELLPKRERNGAT
jgi:hypothetical protein